MAAATASRSFICSNPVTVTKKVSSVFRLGSLQILNYTITRTSTTNNLFSRPNYPILRCIHSSPSQTLATTQQTQVHHPNVIDILQERGLLESTTGDEHIRSACSHDINNSTPIKVYCGFDPTAQSLHLGNLLGIIVLSWFQRCDHKAVALIRGATGWTGDPSSKSLERPELDSDTLDNNILGITNTITRILGNSNAIVGSFSILNNYDWWKEIRLLDFLKRVGRYARVGTMMAKESVKKRLESEQGMSYTYIPIIAGI